MDWSALDHRREVWLTPEGAIQIPKAHWFVAINGAHRVTQFEYQIGPHPVVWFCAAGGVN